MKQRKMNFEMMRIISMLMIVFWHVVCMNGRSDPLALINHTNGFTNLLLNCLYIVTIIHVNSFVIISGYFNYDKDFSKKQFLKVFCASWFYRFFFAMLFCYFGLEVIGSLSFFKQIFPLDITYNYWYINCYLLLYLLTPFLNLFIRNSTQKVHRYCLIIGFIIFCIIPSITNQTTVSTNGFNIVNFCVMYLLGAYLRKYPIKENIHFKNYSNRKIRNIFSFVFISCAIINIMMDQYSTYLMEFESEFIVYLGQIIKSFICNYNNPIVVIQSTAYFIVFSTFSINNKMFNTIIGFLSPLTLGVYLIHFNAYVREYLYKWLGLYNVNYIYSKSVLIKVFVYVIVIFLVCILIEKLRQVLVAYIKSLFKYFRNKKVGV